MHILHLNTTDQQGGAARAAYRLHLSLVRYGLDSRMRVLRKVGSDPRVIGGLSRSISKRIVNKFNLQRSAWIRRNWRTDNPVLHSFGDVSASLVDELNASDADILHLHWVPRMLSVADIGRLRKPIVWTLHDMWPFCGGEHYVEDDEQARFRNGYRVDNRPPAEKGPDLNRRTWSKKQCAWAGQYFTVVSPSHWLARCASESVLLKNIPVHVIPNTLNTDFPWRPVSSRSARNALGLPERGRLILTGAIGGLTDLRKGGEMLHAAVERIVAEGTDTIELVIFGQPEPNEDRYWPCPVHWLGVVNDDRVMALAYSAADVMIVPSRQEAFGQTASEAQACGTPVAAFNIGGLADIVIHRETGWLAKPFDVEDLAAGVSWLLSDEQQHVAIAANARKRAVERYAMPVVASKYIDLYQSVLKSNAMNRCTRL